MSEAVDGTINQISSSSFEWWSSFVCSLLVALFREGFLNFRNFVSKCMTEAVDSTNNQISSSCLGWLSSFVCSLILDLIHDGFWML